MAKRRLALCAAPVVNGLGLSLFGHPLTVALDLGIVSAFAALMMACAVAALRHQD